MVDKDKIRLFYTELGPVIGEEIDDVVEEKLEAGDGLIGLATFKGSVRLRHPFRLITGHGGTMSIGSIFLKEEWVDIPLGKYMELSLNDGLIKLYSDYESQVYSGIVIPTTEDKAALKLV